MPGHVTQSIDSTAHTEDTRLRDLFWILIMASAWALAFAAYSLILHQLFRSTSLDMALHTQILWNLLQGRFMETSFFAYSFAGNHFWPGFYLLLPVYRFFGLHGIIVLQSVVISFSAFPAYWLAKDITNSRAWSFALALAFLLQPTLSIGVTFDYHLELFSVPFALAALLGLRRNAIWFWPSWLIAVAFYELTALVFLFLGVGLLFVQGRRKTGLLLTTLCLVYVGVVFLLVMPHFRGVTAIPHWEQRYAHLGSDPAQAIFNIIRNPIQSFADASDFRDIARWRYLLAAFAFLPLLSLKHLLPAAPLLLALLLNSYSVSKDIRFGYFAPVLPFLFLAAAYGVTRFKTIRFAQKKLSGLRGPMVLVTCSILVFLYFQFNRPIRKQPFSVRPNLATLNDVKQMIPEEASLSADNHLGPHYAEREILLITPSRRHKGQLVEYMLIDLNETEFKEAGWWTSIKDILKGEQYGLLFVKDDVALLKRGATNEVCTMHVLERIIEQGQAIREDR